MNAPSLFSLYCFLGYGIEHKGYRRYDIIDKHLCISRHVTFWEYKFFNSMESFPPCSSPIFTNVFVDLFPNSINLDVGTMISPNDFKVVGPNTINSLVDSFATPHKSNLFVPCRSNR